MAGMAVEGDCLLDTALSDRIKSFFWFVYLFDSSPAGTVGVDRYVIPNTSFC